MKCRHIVGWMYDYDNSNTLTFEDLKEEIEKVKNLNKYKKDNGFEIMMTEEYSLEDYFSGKTRNNIEVFNYCPRCGKKLILEELENDK